MAPSPTPSSDPPDSATWALLFDAEKVGVHTGASAPKDLSDRRVLTFPTAEIADQILNLYLDVAANSPTSFPPATKGRAGRARRRWG